MPIRSVYRVKGTEDKQQNDRNFDKYDDVVECCRLADADY